MPEGLPPRSQVQRGSLRVIGGAHVLSGEGRGGEGTSKVLRLFKSAPARDLALQHTAPLKQAGCRRIYDENVSGAKRAINPS